MARSPQAPTGTTSPALTPGPPRSDTTNRENWSMMTFLPGSQGPGSTNLGSRMVDCSMTLASRPDGASRGRSDPGPTPGWGGPARAGLGWHNARVSDISNPHYPRTRNTLTPLPAHQRRELEARPRLALSPPATPQAGA